MLALHCSLAREPAQDREIQRQHVEIVDTLGMVRERHEHSTGAGLIRAYDDFLACTKAHFAAEELLLGRYAPAELATHKTAHEALLVRALQLRDCLARLDAIQLLRQLQIVESLLTDHCIEEGARLSGVPQYRIMTAVPPVGTPALTGVRRPSAPAK
jgi:hemerythrin